MPPPVEIHPSVLFGISPSGSVPTVSQGTAEAGSIFPSIDGSRFLCVVSEMQAYFVQTKVLPKEQSKLGRVFKQPAPSFGMDVSVGGAAGQLNVKLAATKSVLSDFLDIYMGCMAIAGGPTAYAITGMNVLVTGGRIKRNYSLYVDALEAMVDDNSALRRMMPTFYDHLYVELFLARIEKDLHGKTRDLVTGMIPAPKAVRSLIGVFLGKCGEDELKRMLNGMRDIIRDVLLKVIDHVVSKGTEISDDQAEKLAEHHIIPMYAKLSHVPMRKDRAIEIVNEAARHALPVRPRLVKIANAIDALTA